MKVQGMCFVTCWVLFSGCVTTKEAQVKSEAEDLYDPREDLASFYPGYFKHRKSAKARLEKIEKQLLEIERNGEDTTCARQLERELRWVISYTAHFEKFEARIEKLESLASGRTTDPDAKSQSPIDGSWGSCHDEWFFKLDVSSDALDDLSKAGMLPKYPVKFLDKINSPEKLITYLDSLLISNPSQSGKINRKELNYSVSAFLRTINRDRPPN